MSHGDKKKPSAERVEAGAAGAPCETGSDALPGAGELYDPDRLRGEIADLTDKWLRAAADLENYKKRVARDRERELWATRAGVLLPLLGVLDDLERALERGHGDLDSFREGVALIRERFLAVLGEFGVRPFLSVGEPFDPELHEALQRVPTAEVPEGRVAAEIRRGYRSGERVLRPALVAVAAATERDDVTD